MRLPRPRRRSGQAFIELAVMLPVLVGLIFLMFTYIVHFNRSTTFSRTAAVMAEWIGRAGEYDSALMCPQIRDVLEGTLGVDASVTCAANVGSDVYLYIQVEPPDGSAIISVGTAVGDAQATAPGGPPHQGWATDTGLLPDGALISVNLYAYQRIGALFEGSGVFHLTPVGHAVSIVTSDRPGV